MSRRSALVTGATGVLGRRVVLRLVRAGLDVTGVARSEEKATEVRRAGATPIALDLFDADAVRRAVDGKDVVVSLATAIPPGSSATRKQAWAINHRLRREASGNLSRAAIACGTPRLIQESITLVYAHGGDRVLTESAPLRPTWVTASALDAERHAAACTEAGGTGVVLRFGGFCGFDSHPTQGAIQAARGGWAMAVGARDRFLSPITTDDAAQAVVAALDVPAGIYNVVDDEPVTRAEYFRALAEALGVGPLRFPPAAMAWLMGPKLAMLSWSHRVSNAAFAGATGWRPAYPDVRRGWPAVVAGGGS